MANKDDLKKRNENRISIRMRSINLLQAIYNRAIKFEKDVLEGIRLSSPAFLPLLICLGIIPLLMLFSLFAGWTVWRSVPSGWHEELQLQYGEGSSPYAELDLPWLATWQPYDITLHLLVPATEASYALGNFMTVLSLATMNNESLVSVSKPAIILPPTRGLFSFMFRSSRLVDLTLPMLTSFTSDTSYVRARIELGRRDGWRSVGRGEGRELTVVAAAIRGIVRPQGLRRILSLFPTSIAVASSIAFFATSLVMLACCLIPSIKWRLQGVDEQDQSSPEEVSGKHQLARKRSSSIHHKTADEDFKQARGIYATPEPEFRRRPKREASIKAEAD